MLSDRRKAFDWNRAGLLHRFYNVGMKLCVWNQRKLGKEKVKTRCGIKMIQAQPMVSAFPCTQVVTYAEWNGTNYAREPHYSRTISTTN